MSIRSTIHGSVGKVSVPAAGNSRTPSISWSTDPWPLNPRAASAVLPLPRLPTLVMPGARLSASAIAMSPRARIVAPSMTDSVAGVSSGDRLSRLAVPLGTVRSASWRPVTMMSSDMGSAVCALAGDASPIAKPAAMQAQWRLRRAPIVMLMVFIPR